MCREPRGTEICVLPGRAEGAGLNLSQHPRQQNMQLISNWKDALRMSSVQAGGAIAAPGILVMLARVILQPKLSY
jgi:hypothetical protein